jgi:hypothetical protein
MAEIKVEDLIRGIREGAARSEPSPSLPENTARSLSRLETSLTIIARTQDQLPPVTTYRTGLLARMELWTKRQLRRATHWFTWEQVNFNSSVNSALNNTLATLRSHEQLLASLQLELDAGVAARSGLEARLGELESRLALIESRFDEILAETVGEIRSEHQKRLELLLNEQRVCFKQLALEISEAGVIADRAKRSMQLKLEELAGRVDEMNVEQRDIQSVGGEATNNRESTIIPR